MKDTIIKIRRFVARRTHQAETIVIFIVASEIISLFFILFLLLQSRWLGLEVNVGVKRKCSSLCVQRVGAVI
jgi:hypothetical protein